MAELVKLQSRTGQIAFVYRPHLIGIPMRICVGQAIGANSKEVLNAAPAALQSLQAAPLEADAAGLAILACLGIPSLAEADLSLVREEGYAVGTAPLPNRDMIAAPVWCDSAIAGAVALLPTKSQMRRATSRARYTTAVMDAAATVSGQLTRSRPRRTT